MEMRYQAKPYTRLNRLIRSATKRLVVEQRRTLLRTQEDAADRQARCIPP